MVGLSSLESSVGVGVRLCGWRETASRLWKTSVPYGNELIGKNRYNRHVAIKVLSAFASRELKAGRLVERELLRQVTTASPLHQGFGHVIHLLHEFTFESAAGQHVCFVTDVLSYSLSGLQSRLKDPRLPLAFILCLTKHVLKGLEYLHDECKVVHSGMTCAFFSVAIGESA